MLGISRAPKNIQPSKGVCRCLFGVDHEETRKTLNRENERLESDNNERWNFDFTSETPIINGKFTWMKVAVDEEIPIAYKMPNLALTNYLFMNLTQIMDEKHEEKNEVEEVQAPQPVRTSRKRKLSSSRQCNITGKYLYLLYLLTCFITSFCIIG